VQENGAKKLASKAKVLRIYKGRKPITAQRFHPIKRGKEKEGI
jgi:hypothetical protein